MEDTKMIVTEENIDDLIEKWHDGDSKLPLHEYLGLTFEEYAYFVEKGELPHHLKHSTKIVIKLGGFDKMDKERLEGIEQIIEAQKGNESIKLNPADIEVLLECANKVVKIKEEVAEFFDDEIDYMNFGERVINIMR